MSVPGATDAVRNANPAPTNSGADSSKQAKEFKELVNRSTTSSNSSQPSQGTSNSNPIILASRPPINLAHPTGKQGVPLYQSQGAGSTTAQQAATPAKPGKPIDVAQMEALNGRVQSFNVARSPVDHQQLQDAQQHFQDATDALKAGDYKKAEAELRTLGFPLPAAGGQLSTAAQTSAILLGSTPVHADRGGGWQTDSVRWGARGNQALNDMNGFAANAKMINRLASAPGGVSNPPTETQVTQYMHDLTNPPKGKTQPTSQQVMQAASDITGGMIMHYSSAGRQDPVYNANPSPHAFYKDRAGKIHEFGSVADAQKAAAAARAHKSPDAPAGRITSDDRALARPVERRDVARRAARGPLHRRLREQGVHADAAAHLGRLHVARQRRRAARGRHRPHVRRVQGARRHDLGHVERRLPSGEPEQCQGGRDAGRPRRDAEDDDRRAVPHPEI